MRTVIELLANDARCAIDDAAGGRIAALEVAGLDVLVARETNPMAWGSYVMVPFAGRMRHGRFRFRGHDHALPPTMGPHAIHGYGYVSAWAPTDNGALTLALSLDGLWPLGGRVEQRFALTDDSLTQDIAVHADDSAILATVGWHPWFRRELGRGAPLTVNFDQRDLRMYERDHEGIPTGRLTAPGPHPWDDCFAGVGAVTLRWPGALELLVTHDCSEVVIYEPDHAICVEPQTGPPDAFNLIPDQCVVEPGCPLTASMTWAWRRI